LKKRAMCAVRMYRLNDLKRLFSPVLRAGVVCPLFVMKQSLKNLFVFSF
jgi:hypothetical protein